MQRKGIYMKSSITEASPEALASEMYRIGAQLRALAEMTYSQAIKRGSQEHLQAYSMLREVSEICESLGEGFLETLS